MWTKITIIYGGGQLTFMLRDEAICKTVAEVQEFCYTRFPELKQYKELKIFWYDNEGDEICVLTDDDYQNFRLLADENNGRLFVEGKEASRLVGWKLPAESAATTSGAFWSMVHKNVVCDVCHRGVVGYRYRCLSCHDFDMCMSCEVKFGHKDHIVMRVPRPTVGLRAEESRAFEKIRQYAQKLQLQGEKETSSFDKNGDTAKATAAPRCLVNRSSEVTRKSKRVIIPPVEKKNTDKGERRHHKVHWASCHCKHHSVTCKTEQQAQKSMHKANMAAAAMLRGQAKQVKFREILSRYVDPANIDCNDRPSASTNTSPLSANVEANVASPSPSVSDDDVLAEARRSLKVTSEAAKLASDAAWGTFRECAKLFVPVLSAPATPNNGSSSMDAKSRTTPASRSVAGTPTAALASADANDPGFSTAVPGTSKTQSPEGTTGPTQGFGDNLLNAFHQISTLPPYGWMLPSEGEMRQVAKKMSEMLHPLGLDLSFPKSISPEASSSPNTAEVKSETTEVPHSGTDEKEKKVQPTIPDEGPEKDLQATVAGQKEEKESPLQNDAVLVDADAVMKKPENAESAIEIDDSSSDTSSASLLTDDDEDVLQAAEVFEDRSVSSSTSPAREVTWTLVDLPDDHKEEAKQNAVDTTAGSSLVPEACPAVSSCSTEKVKQQSTEDTPLQGEKLDDFYRTTLEDMVDFVKQFTLDSDTAQEKTPELKARCSKEKNGFAQDDRYIAHFEKAFKEIEEHMKSEIKKRQTKEPQSVDATTAAVLTKEKKSSPLATPPSQSSPSTSKGPSTSSALPTTTPASSGTRKYSPRPHVNHAIHTMMTMGFSNHDGHLTKLLEALNGDIPRALDMLMQKIS